MKYCGREMTPAAVRDLSDRELKKLAAFLRQEIIAAVAANGGHLSSNLGIVEITLGLCRVFDPLRDDIVFDVGHQTYAYKLLTGRSLENLRKKGGTAPFSSLAESPYDKISNGHSSTSLSVAYGMAKAKKLQGDDSYTIAVIGDGSITNGLAFEALNLIASEKDLRLIVVLNDNGMSISRATGSVARGLSKIRTSKFYVSRAMSFRRLANRRGFRWLYSSSKKVKDSFKRFFLPDTIFEAMDIAYNGVFDGNSIEEVSWALRYASRLESPILLHFFTKKGLGYEFAADDDIGCWHGTEPFDIATGKAISRSKRTSFSDLAGSVIAERLKSDPLAFLICPAMVYGSRLARCFSEHPERCLDVGISEEHAITMAAGLFLSGLHPIVSIYSTFLQRSYDEVLHDLARMLIPALVFVERCGLVGADGSSHQGIYDVAFLSTIPEVAIWQPVEPADLGAICAAADFSRAGPTFVRLVKADFEAENLHLKPAGRLEPFEFSSNKSRRALVATGPLGASLIGENRDFDGFLIKKIFPVLPELTNQLLAYDEIVIYDPYSTEEGLASCLCLELARRLYPGKMQIYAIPRAFVGVGTPAEQLAELGLDLASVSAKIRR